MKLRIYNLLIIILLSFTTQVKGQISDLGLKIGDSLPIFKISKMIHSKKMTGNTEDYRNQLLIIDFWATSCGSCIISLPKMEELEKHFGSKIRILPVTDQKQAKILDFWKNNKYTRNLKGASVVEDTLFNKYFKHKYIPHEVWIYKGKVIAITSMEYVDSKNIERVLNGESIDWPVKNDFYVFDRNKPLFILDEGQINSKSTSIRYSAISDFRQKNNSPIWLSGGSGIERDSLKKTARIFFLNQPILNSYLIYWTQLKLDSLIRPYYSFQPNQVVWEVANRSKYFFENKFGNYSQDWLVKNGICFESLYPDTGQNDYQIYRSAISDLDRLLGLRVRWERRNERVLILKRKDSFKDNHNNKYSKGIKYTVFDIFKNLNEQPNNPYVFNESNDEKTEVPLDMSSWSDILNIKKSLIASGFDLIEQERIVDKLIFTEIDGGRLVDIEMQTKAKERRKNQDNIKDVRQEDNILFLSNNIKNPEIKQTASGLQYKVLNKGNNRSIQASLESKVLVHYEGKLINGKIFDSSYESGFPVEMKVDGVIKGWTEALQLMHEGDIWELYIPSSLAYENHTGNGRFPPNSTLIYKLELIKVLK